MAFAEAGAQTVLAVRSEENLKRTADEIAAAGGPRPVTIAADLGTTEACHALFGVSTAAQNPAKGRRKSRPLGARSVLSGMG
jgi:NAD(P)-dependent dehydrogenase (short-subunit alcohol dehydrogenase family)